MSTCRLYVAGHRIHPIQASLAWNDPRDGDDSRVRVPVQEGVSFDKQADRHIPVTVNRIDDSGLIAISAGDLDIALWHHHVEAIRGAMAFQGYAHTWVPSASVFIVNQFTVDDPIEGSPVSRVIGHAYFSVTRFDNPERRECLF